MKDKLTTKKSRKTKTKKQNIELKKACQAIQKNKEILDDLIIGPTN